MSIKISVVIPVFNEEGNISVLYKRLKKALGGISRNYEIIFVNDGSTDKTLRLLRLLRRSDSRVKYLSFSRNFGHMPAVVAGLKAAKGKKVVLMDADLQDPPEVIAKMYEESNKGFDVVYGVKTKRKEKPFKRFLFSAFYKILDRISAYKMPSDAGTFSLIDRKVVNILVNLEEKNMYFSGLRSWVGFKQKGVTYERGKRLAGKPASFRKLLKLAMDGFVSFSYIPLRIATFLGFVFAFFAFLMIIFVLIMRIFFHWGIVGWASTMSAILFIGGVQLITLGIIGEYLGRIYDQVKNRPEFIIAEKGGL